MSTQYRLFSETSRCVCWFPRFLSNHCGGCFAASHTKRHLGKTQCIPAGKGMGSQQAFGIWYANVSEQVDMIKVNEWETIPDFSYYCVALNICWHFFSFGAVGKPFNACNGSPMVNRQVAFQSSSTTAITKKHTFKQKRIQHKTELYF